MLFWLPTFNNDSTIFSAFKAMFASGTVCWIIIPSLCFFKRRKFKDSNSFNLGAFNDFMMTIECTESHRMTH